MQEDVLATVAASAPRRWIGVGMLITVGSLVIYVALVNPPEFGWQMFLLTMGGASFWLSQRMWNATEETIELTRDVLRTGSGQVICEVNEIEGIDRGVFAFKPSNGFLIITRSSGGRSWAPGLWWRMGRRIGIGGMTAAAEAKFMSEMLSAMLAERA